MVTVFMVTVCLPPGRVKVSPVRLSTPSLTYTQSFLSSLKVV